MNTKDLVMVLLPVKGGLFLCGDSFCDNMTSGMFYEIIHTGNDGDLVSERYGDTLSASLCTDPDDFIVIDDDGDAFYMNVAVDVVEQGGKLFKKRAEGDAAPEEFKRDGKVLVSCAKPVTGGCFVAGKDLSDEKLVTGGIYDIVFVGGDMILQEMCEELKLKARWCREDDEFVILLPNGMYGYMNILSDIKGDGGELWGPKDE